MDRLCTCGHTVTVVAAALINMAAARGYLLLYNIAQSVGWAVALMQTLLVIVQDSSLNNVYAAAGGTVSK